MTRKAKIDFIRKHDKYYANKDFTDYDNDDISNLFYRFSYSGSKEAREEYEKMVRQDNPFDYWWYKALDKLSFGNTTAGVVLIILFNPIMVFFEILIILGAIFLTQ